MPKNWKKYKLGDICDLRKDSISPKKFNNELYIGLEHIGQGTFLLEGIGNASDVSSNKYRFLSGDILYGKIRPYFKKVYQPNFSGICSTDMLIFKTENEEIVNQSFLYHLIKTQEFTDRATETSSGTKMPRADWNSLKQIEYKFPPLPEQKAIASILSALDDKIENNLAMNKTLEDMAMALYNHWFVDFGPFQEGNFIDSELGEIPEGWEVKRLDDISTVVDSLHKTPKYSEIGYPMVRVTNVKGGFLDLSKTLKVDKQVFQEFSKKHLPKTGDIIMTRVGTYGVCSLVSTEDDFCLGQNTVVIISNFDSSYLFSALSSTKIKEQIEEQVTGSTQKTISLKSIRALKVVLPINLSNQILNQFITQVSEFYLLGGKLNNENQTLTQLRDTLLPKLISGEVRLKEFEEEITAAL
ncbi:restriction endonuclease subunit S [Cellulophaga baltica]|uniref:restriction endonuclease subunit S n=1 Tax=Cellulophaga baltica TaxID=76594 RepID=UPI0024959515|nr:restriction endonuclease subunit S [Cellulophaga baltica]